MKQGDAAQTAYYLSKQKKTSHLLHLVLSVLTLGVWLPIWLLVAISNGSDNLGTRQKAREAAGVKPGKMEAIGEGIAALFYLAFWLCFLVVLVALFF